MSPDDIPEIDPVDALVLLKNGAATFADVRDTLSHQYSRIPGAIHLHDNNVMDFIEDTPKDRPVVIYCYHGHTSLGGTAFLLQHGFRVVYSLRGGFEGWRLSFPVETSEM